MPKQLLYAHHARERMLRGVEKLADVVAVTLGPTGRNVILDKSFGGPTVTKDGVTVSKEIELEDRFENMGAKLVNEVASKTSDVAGDGTTTATVLARAIFREGLRNIAAGSNPTAIRRGIDKAVEAAIEHLRTMAKPVASKEEMASVGSISANNDPDDRQSAGRGDGQGRQGRRHHRRGRQDGRDDLRGRRGHAVRQGLSLALLHQPRARDGLPAGRRLHPDPREEDQQPARPDSAVGEGDAARQAAVDHRRGRRGRGADDAGGQQAPRHSARSAR